MEKVEIEVEIETIENETNRLIVYNDDFNTFDHVIKALIDLCGHSLEQAEQCTLLIHYKGKASVKEGSKQELKPIKEALLDRLIDARIE